MKITLEDMIAKHNACVDSLDQNKQCGTCLHLHASVEVEPCFSCYNAMFSFPVNPTKWEAKEKGGYMTAMQLFLLNVITGVALISIGYLWIGGFFVCFAFCVWNNP